MIDRLTNSEEELLKSLLEEYEDELQSDNVGDMLLEISDRGGVTTEHYLFGVGAVVRFLKNKAGFDLASYPDIEITAERNLVPIDVGSHYVYLRRSMETGEIEEYKSGNSQYFDVNFPVDVYFEGSIEAKEFIDKYMKAHNKKWTKLSSYRPYALPGVFKRCRSKYGDYWIRLCATPKVLN